MRKGVIRSQILIHLFPQIMNSIYIDHLMSNINILTMHWKKDLTIETKFFEDGL